MNKVYAGIDYSMSSPGLAIWDSSKPFNFDNVDVFALNGMKKVIGKHPFGIQIQKMPSKDEWATNEERYDQISSWVIKIFQAHGVTDVYLESYAFGAKGLVFHIGENTGVLKHKLWNLSIPITVFAPGTIKKIATGKGNANKERLNESFVEETGVDIKALFKQSEKSWNPSSDIIDAYYILKTGLLDANIINK